MKVALMRPGHCHHLWNSFPRTLRYVLGQVFHHFRKKHIYTLDQWDPNANLVCYHITWLEFFSRTHPVKMIKNIFWKKIREIEILHIWDRRSGWLIHEWDIGLRILTVYHGEMGKYHSLKNKSSTIMPKMWQIWRKSLFTLSQRY